jgi:DNA-binding CsgD family transcriptional regulator
MSPGARDAARDMAAARSRDDGAAAALGTGWRQTPLRPQDVLALELVARGYSSMQIAQLRRVRVTEVNTSLRRALRVFGVVTVGQAAAEARRRGLID